MSKIDDILPALHEVLNCVKGDWMIIGTSSLYLSGHSVAPNDIDILADKATTAEIEAVLASYRVDTDVRANEKFRSRFSKYNFQGFDIEVMGDLEVNTVTGWVLLRDQISDPQSVLFNGKSFVVPSKQDQIAIYTLFNRVKDDPVLRVLLSDQ